MSSLDLIFLNRTSANATKYSRISQTLQYDTRRLVLTLVHLILSEQAAHGGFPQPEGRRSGRVHLQEVIKGSGVAESYGSGRHPLCGQREETQRQEGPEAPLKGRQVNKKKTTFKRYTSGLEGDAHNTCL